MAPLTIQSRTGEFITEGGKGRRGEGRSVLAPTLVVYKSRVGSIIFCSWIQTHKYTLLLLGCCCCCSLRIWLFPLPIFQTQLYVKLQFHIGPHFFTFISFLFFLLIHHLLSMNQWINPMLTTLWDCDLQIYNLAREICRKQQ